MLLEQTLGKLSAFRGQSAACVVGPRRRIDRTAEVPRSFNKRLVRRACHGNQGAVPIIHDGVGGITAKVVLQLLVPQSRPTQRSAQYARTIRADLAARRRSMQGRGHEQESLTFANARRLTVIRHRSLAAFAVRVFSTACPITPPAASPSPCCSAAGPTDPRSAPLSRTMVRSSAALDRGRAAARAG